MNDWEKERRGRRYTRRTDPATSRKAAQSVRDETISKAKTAILDLLKDGPMADEDIAHAFHVNEAINGATRLYSPSGLRTRRSELVEAGLIEDSGERGKTQAGRDTILWRLKARQPEEVRLPF